jgi:hypothetical protein
VRIIWETMGDVARFVVAVAVAFVVALLPQRYKRRGPLAAYADARVHAFSAMAESAAGAILFISGMIAFGHSFGQYVYIYAATQPQTKLAELFGMGALAYISYLLTPAAWLFLYLFIEGLVRGLEVAFHGSQPGLGLLHVGMRLADLARRALREAHRKSLAGPPRPDEVIMPDTHPEGLLEIRCARPKPWSERQVLTMDGEFYLMVGLGFGKREERHAHWYLFRPLEEREVMRGAIAAYPSEEEGGRDEEAGGASGEGRPGAPVARPADGGSAV